MIVAPVTASAYSLASYLNGAEIVDSTTAATGRVSIRIEEPVTRSYLGRPSWKFANVLRETTPRHENLSLLIGPDLPEDGIVAELNGFLELDAGWDGESAAKPHPSSVRDAVRFVRVAGGCAVHHLEPTLHVDGSVILEIGEGSEGSLRFKGDGAIIYATEKVGIGIVAFDGYSVPLEIKPALQA